MNNYCLLRDGAEQCRGWDEKWLPLCITLPPLTNQIACVPKGSQGTWYQGDWEVKRWADTLWPPQALDKHGGALLFIIILFQRDRLLTPWQVVLVIWMSITEVKSPGMCKKKRKRLTMQLELLKCCCFSTYVTFRFLGFFLKCKQKKIAFVIFFLSNSTLLCDVYN